MAEAVSFSYTSDLSFFLGSLLNYITQPPLQDKLPCGEDLMIREQVCYLCSSPASSTLFILLTATWTQWYSLQHTYKNNSGQDLEE